MPELYLGIDTSNYKTSVAVTDGSNHTVFEKSEYLDVPQGSRGLRQSEAFFRHSNRLPAYIEEMCDSIDISLLRAAGVSSRPRRVDGSYMPCFLAGVNAAKEIASVLGIPLHEFSHQEGHAAAVLENDTESVSEQTALFHLSGGTTELLICRPDDKGYHLEIAGGTLDISVGQLIDRAGVAMGYPFPAGAYLDELALSCYEENPACRHKASSLLPRVRLKDGYFNLSGVETKVLRIIEKADVLDYPEIAYSIFAEISQLLAESAVYASGISGTSAVYMAGGVSASSFIRRQISERISSMGNTSLSLQFGEPALSGDNAVGIARLARRINNQ